MSAEEEKVLRELNPWMKIPAKITLAGRTFLAESLRLEEFDAFLTHLHLFVLQNPQHVSEHYQEIRKSHPAYAIMDKDKTEDEFKQNIYRSYSLEAHKRVVDEMLYCKLVDNWLIYICDVLAIIFTARPEALRSSEQVRIDYILQFKDTDTMIAALVEREVEKLAYLGVKDLADFFSKELNFSLATDGTALEMLIEAVEIRKLLVHARGKVSKIFKNRIPRHSGELGEEVPLGNRELLRQNLYCLAVDIDERVVEKWDLPFILTRKSASE